MSQLIDAFWSLVLWNAPLRYGRDRVYVSVEALPLLKATLTSDWQNDVIFADSFLKGVEMRLERDCR